MTETINTTAEASTSLPITAIEPIPSHLLPTYTSPITGQTFTNHGYVAEDATVLKTDWEDLYNNQKAETARLSTIIDAARVAPSAAPAQRVQPAITADRVKATVSPTAFLKMTREDKIRSLGVDPASITDDGLRKVFGRGCDNSLKVELMNVSPRRYAELKQVSLILNIFAA